MISNADLVTFFDSSSIVDAILLNKKIFSLSSTYMGKNERIHSTVYSKKLNMINIELSNFKEEDFAIASSYKLESFKTGAGVSYDVNKKIKHSVDLDYVIKNYKRLIIKL